MQYPSNHITSNIFKKKTFLFERCKMDHPDKITLMKYLVVKCVIDTIKSASL